MIHTQISRITESNEFALLPGVNIALEGQALVRDVVNGVIGVRPSEGDAGEVFVGFSLIHTTGVAIKQFSTVFARDVLMTGTGVIKLDREPIAGSVFVRNRTTGAAVTLGTLTGLNQAVTGTAAGDQLTVIYRPVLSELEATFSFGDGQPSGYSGNHFRQVGVAQAGLIYTDHFDTSVNWSAAATVVVLGENGQLTSAANNADGVVIGAKVIAAPTQDLPYLAIQFNAGA